MSEKLKPEKHCVTCKVEQENQELTAGMKTEVRYFAPCIESVDSFNTFTGAGFRDGFSVKDHCNECKTLCVWDDKLIFRATIRYMIEMKNVNS